MKTQVKDLRSALELLRGVPGQLIETDVEVDPMAELSGVYRHIGAGGTVMRPTKEGPAMIFNGSRATRMQEWRLGSCFRKRVACFWVCAPKPGQTALKAYPTPFPVLVEGHAPCQEVVHRV